MPEAPADRRKIEKEILVFLLFMGLLIGGLGYVCYTMISRDAKPLRGIARHVLFGVPLLGCGGVLLLSGVLFGATKKAFFAGAGAVALALLAAAALILTGISLGNGLLVAAPLLLAQRLSVLSKAPPGSPTIEPKVPPSKSP